MAEIKAYRANKNHNISFRLSEREYYELLKFHPEFENGKSKFIRAIIKEKIKITQEALYKNEQL